MRGWARRHRVACALGLAAVVASAGGAAFALAGGLDEATTVRVAGDGPRVVRVALVDRAVGFDVTPDVVEVEEGTHVVLDVVNEASGEHDLALDGGPGTDVLAPGDSQRLDLGRVGDGPTGRCTIGDHDLAGMTVELRLA